MMRERANATQAREAPERDSTKRTRRAAIVEAMIVVLLGIVVGLVGVSRPLNAYDEAIVLVGAERIRAGELPFRDFYAVYPPAQDYALAGLFGIFGVKAITLRVYCVVVRALVAFVLYRTTRQLAGRVMGAASWCACILWLTASGFYGYPTFPALLFAWTGLSMLLGCMRKAQADDSRSIPRLPKGWMFAAGGAAGAAALFRHDLAFYAVLASLPSLFVLLRFGTGPGERAASRHGTELLRAWPYAAGMALVFGVPAVLLLSRVPIAEVVSELFTYPLTGYAQARGLPYPPLLEGPLSFSLFLDPRPFVTFENVCFYAPLVFDAAAIVWFAARVRRDHAFVANADGLALASTALLSALLFNLARVRPDTIHILAMVLPSLTVAAALIRKAWIVPHVVRRGAAVGMTGIFLLMLAFPYHAFPRPSWSEIVQVLFGPPEVGRERTSHVDTGADRDAVAAYLRSVVAPEGRIFVACGRHDRVLVNETILYFLAARLPGAKYHSFDPGVATTLEAQREMVEGLERHRVEYVAISTADDNSTEPNLSSLGGGSTYLDEYLQRNYREAYRASPSLSVWRRSTGWDR